MEARIKEQFIPIKSYIERSEKEGQSVFCYEVTMLSKAGERTEIISRTRGTSSFDGDMDESMQLAQAANAELEITVYGGMSNNASVKNRHHISINTPIVHEEQKPDLRSIIREEMQAARGTQIDPTTQGIGSLNLLVDAMSGKADTNEGIAGLFGIASSLAENQSKAQIAELHKKFDLHKQATKYEALEEKYNILKEKYDTLSLSSNANLEELKSKKEELKQLEDRLASYAPNELMKRVGIGVLSNIGGRILGNSPKAADAMGLTPDELKGALGLLEESTETPQAVIDSPAVTMAAVEEPLSPEEQEKKQYLDHIHQLISLNPNDVIAEIYGMLQIILSGPDEFNLIRQMINNVKRKSEEKASQVIQEQIEE